MLTRHKTRTYFPTLTIAGSNPEGVTIKGINWNLPNQSYLPCISTTCQVLGHLDEDPYYKPPSPRHIYIQHICHTTDKQPPNARYRCTQTILFSTQHEHSPTRAIHTNISINTNVHTQCNAPKERKQINISSTTVINHHIHTQRSIKKGDNQQICHHYVAPSQQFPWKTCADKSKTP